MNPRIKNTILSEHKKCIINADLDGILCGTILSNALNWEVVGYSMCNGKITDDLWLPEDISTEDAMNECVFLDLPVVKSGVATIDQHFNAFDDKDVSGYLNDYSKINPNMLRSMYYSSSERGYTRKYPFGTIHFIIAVLEKYKKMVSIDINKDLGGFKSIDVLLRADRVIGNSVTYNANCKDWINYLAKDNNGIVTNTIRKIIFDGDLDIYSRRETMVEEMLKSYGCSRKDGDCSMLLMNGQYSDVFYIIMKIANIFGLKPPKVRSDLIRCHALTGQRYPIFGGDFSIARRKTLERDVFSYAIVSSREVSITKLKS